jgi:hypothetical protein
VLHTERRAYDRDTEDTAGKKPGKRCEQASKDDSYNISKKSHVFFLLSLEN